MAERMTTKLLRIVEQRLANRLRYWQQVEIPLSVEPTPGGVHCLLLCSSTETWR